MEIDMGNRIEIDPRVCNGRPVISGTRITISVILDHLAAGLDRAKILEEYPELDDIDITAAIEYAKEYIDNSEVAVVK
jgi:uncharacterized protein (DUF433 family)